jgi:hypothetical protein
MGPQHPGHEGPLLPVPHVGRLDHRAQADQSWRVGYLFRINKNGDATYMTPDGRLSATINAKGVVAAPTNRPAGVDCYGKTLDELRSGGRIMEFQRTK